MTKNLFTLFAMVALAGFAGCSDDDGDASPVDTSLNAEILESFSTNLPQTQYADLAAKTSILYNQALALQADGATDVELDAARATWKAARLAWEQSESFLIGPVSTDDIDPRIDTWPVNFTDLDAQLASESEFNEAYVADLEDALKGFHPIEYLIFGIDGNKSAEDLTSRQLEYLTALALNLKTLTAELEGHWENDPSTYYTSFSNAGSGSTVYSTQRAAFEEMVNAMIGICDEVANGKIGEPFTLQDPSLEESPFSQNSITDFTNNMKGVQNVYLGKYSSDGKGLEDLVRKYNLQLDGELKAAMSAAITTLATVTDPFGEAITSQPVQVQNSIDAIADLKITLEDKLLPFVQQHTK